MKDARFGLDFAGKHELLEQLHASCRAALVSDPARSIRFDEARDVFIEGDNLEALRILQWGYQRRFQMIYIDPPYNTGHDFVYRDRWGETTEAFLQRTGQKDERGQALVVNPSASGRYHSAWLAMMYPRLFAARQLLRDDGILFVSIDDHEVHHLRVMLDEIFGADCFIAQIVVVTNRGGRDYLRVATGHEYLLCYGATPDAPIRELPRPLEGRVLEDARGPYVLRELRNRNPKFHPGNRPNLFYPVFVDPDSVDADGHCSVSIEESARHRIRAEPRNRAGEGSVWRWSAAKMAAAMVPGDSGASEVVARCRRDGVYNVYEKHRKTTTRPRALWDEPEMRSERGTLDLREALGGAVFDHPKPVALVRRCLQMATDPDALVLDFFAGSGTTAQAVVEQNREDEGQRRYVLVQLPEAVPAQTPASAAGHATIADIARARIAKVGAAGGVRCFTLADRESDHWSPPTTRDPAAYLETLEHHASAIRARDPFQLALEHGLQLGCPFERVSEGIVRLFDPDTRTTLVVSTKAALRPAEIDTLDLPPQTVLCCAEAALDDNAMLRLARRYDLRPW